LVEEGAGQRVIGDSIRPIETGELSLLGANLPHVWRYLATGHAKVRASVIHFEDDFAGVDFLKQAEMREIRLLLVRAVQGLLIGGKTRKKVTKLVHRACRHDGFERVLDLLEILHCLSVSKELVPICSPGYQPTEADLHLERLKRVLQYIDEHLDGPIDRDTAATLIHLSPNGFSRFFRTHTGRTFQDFVIDRRISHACQLLFDANLSVTDVAFQCGFGSIAGFNRTFKRMRQMNPTEYRRRMTEVTA